MKGFTLPTGRMCCESPAQVIPEELRVVLLLSTWAQDRSVGVGFCFPLHVYQIPVVLLSVGVKAFALKSGRFIIRGFSSKSVVEEVSIVLC